jgi:hypothetical protein
VGSDRADALHIAAAALIQGHYPYHALTYLGNPITPLPGAVLLAVPFLLIGNVSLQNLLWLALFLGLGQWFFRSRSASVACVLLLLGGSAANLDDFVVGGDFFTNILYVCIAVGMVLAVHDGGHARWKQVAAAIFLGLAINSRPVYIVVVPLLIAYALQRSGRDRALRLMLISGAVATLLSLPFYLYDPAHFSPLHIRSKLVFLPVWLHADLLLPALALLISCSAFLVHLTRERVFLFTAMSLLVMFGPPAIMGWFFRPFTIDGWFALSLFSAPAVFCSLWILMKYERSTAPLRTRMPDEAIASVSS